MFPPAQVDLNGQTHHSGMTCDGCDGQIFGARYKCVACEYDLVSERALIACSLISGALSSQSSLLHSIV